MNLYLFVPPQKNTEIERVKKRSKTEAKNEALFQIWTLFQTWVHVTWRGNMKQTLFQTWILLHVPSPDDVRAMSACEQLQEKESQNIPKQCFLKTLSIIFIFHHFPFIFLLTRNVDLQNVAKALQNEAWPPKTKPIYSRYAAFHFQAADLPASSVRLYIRILHYYTLTHKVHFLVCLYNIQI